MVLRVTIRLLLVLAPFFFLLIYLWVTRLKFYSTKIYSHHFTVTLQPQDDASSIGQPVTFLDLIEQRVPSLFKPFKPAWWLPNGHLQTIYCSLGDFSRVDPIKYERKFFLSPDGGLFTVDVTPPFSTRAYMVGEPILIVLHGLTGGSHESYVRAILSSVVPNTSNGGLGMRGVVLNFRGSHDFPGAESPLLSKKLYHAGSTEDLRSLILWFSATMPASPLYAIGFSLGANVLVNYCGEEGIACPLTAAVSMANIWDYYKAGHHIESGSLFNRYVYDLVLGDSLRNLIKKHLDIFWDETRFSVAELLARPFVRMRYYCDVVNSHLGGFKDANDYYKKASCVQRISRVRTPILAINSRDDPIAHLQNVIPFAEIQSSPYIVLATTGGGHVGWFEGGNKRWYVEPVREFLRAFLELKLPLKPRPKPLPPNAGMMVYQEGSAEVGYAEVKGGQLDALFSERQNSSYIYAI